MTGRLGLRAQNEVRTTLLQGLGGIVVLVGAYFTYRQLHTSREGQITERFTRAIDQLGHPQLDVRLGGIYALERIARDSPADRTTIGEILTAYVRSRAPWPPTLSSQYVATAPIREVRELQIRAPDVQAVLTVLGRGGFADPKGVDSPLDLHAVDLRHAHLPGAHLKRANLDGAHLEGANLLGAHLKGAYLLDAHLEGADLSYAHLEGVDLRRARLDRVLLHGAHLEGADLSYAHLEGAAATLHSVHLEAATLFGAHLEGANLLGAHLERANLRAACLNPVHLIRAHLEGADLRASRLEGANLREAHLEQANLDGAHLEESDLREAHLEAVNLHRAHLDGAVTNTLTSWPAEFEPHAAGVIVVDDAPR